MARDRKYGQVELEHGDFGDDELIFVFRATDSTLPELLYSYRQLCMQAGSPKYHVDQIDASYAEIKQYQKDHPDEVKVPDSQNYKERTDGHSRD